MQPALGALMLSFLRRSSRPLVQVAILGLLAGGTLVLVGDSAECPDGYAPQTYDASFVSTCPASLAPASGTLRLSLPGTIEDQLRVAGFTVDLSLIHI